MPLRENYSGRVIIAGEGARGPSEEGSECQRRVCFILDPGLLKATLITIMRQILG
jgi:hypothetical protein